MLVEIAGEDGDAITRALARSFVIARREAAK